MCGRYTYFASEFSDLRLTWKADSIPILRPRFNIAGRSGSMIEVEALIPKPFELDEVVSIVRSHVPCLHSPWGGGLRFGAALALLFGNNMRG
jgi:hypothetical protein